MTQLYLVRHGQTEWSLSGQHTSVTDLPLTTEGEQQALSLRARLDPTQFGLVLTSPRIRATRTAELAGFTGQHAPQIDEDLAEWFYGDYEGLTSEQIQRRTPGWTIWSRPSPGGETADQVAGRLDRVVARVRESGVERAVCFAHGHSLRVLALRWLGLAPTLGAHLSLDTATVSVLDADRGVPTLERWNVSAI